MRQTKVINLQGAAKKTKSVEITPKNLIVRIWKPKHMVRQMHVFLLASDFMVVFFIDLFGYIK